MASPVRGSLVLSCVLPKNRRDGVTATFTGKFTFSIEAFTEGFKTVLRRVSGPDQVI